MNSFINKIISYIYAFLFLFIFVHAGRPNGSPLDLKRLLFITYISFLYTSYFFYYPTFTNFVNMMILYLLSLFYYIKLKTYNKLSILFHIIIIIPPLLLTFIFIQFQNYTYSFSYASFFLLVYLIFMNIFKKYIYGDLKQI